MTVAEKLELLTPDLLSKHQETVHEIISLQNALWREIGWHYLVDLVWILAKVECLGLEQSATILDAGSGRGLLQYLLASRGYRVMSVDYHSFRPPLLARLAFPHNRWHLASPSPEDSYRAHLRESDKLTVVFRRLLKRFKRVPFNGVRYLKFLLRRHGLIREPVGTIEWIQADLRNLSEIPDRSVDAVVSVSVIEHIPRSDLSKVIIELRRVLREGAPIILTTSAAPREDWFHEPSQGWCFSYTTLNELFELSAENCYSKAEYRDMLYLYKSSKELEERLASAYFLSGNNGMPWGRWDPQYVPVGIVKYP